MSALIQLVRLNLFKYSSAADIFAFAFIFSRIISITRTTGLHEWPLLLLGLLALALPRIFFLFLIFLLLSIWQQMPDVKEQALVTFLVGLPILLTQVSSWKNTNWYQENKSFIKVFLIIFYFFAFFHKLNWDFINPEKSCSSLILKVYSSPFYEFSGIALLVTQFIFIFITYLVEGLLPPFLFKKKALRFVLPLMILFHFVLSYIFLRFSFLMIALLLVFMPEPFFEKENYKELDFVFMIATLILALALMAQTEYLLPMFFFQAWDLLQFLGWAFFTFWIWKFALKFILSKNPAGPAVTLSDVKAVVFSWRIVLLLLQYSLG